METLAVERHETQGINSGKQEQQGGEVGDEMMGLEVDMDALDGEQSNQNVSNPSPEIDLDKLLEEISLGTESLGIDAQKYKNNGS